MPEEAVLRVAGAQGSTEGTQVEKIHASDVSQIAELRLWCWCLNVADDFFASCGNPVAPVGASAGTL